MTFIYSRYPTFSDTPGMLRTVKSKNVAPFIKDLNQPVNVHNTTNIIVTAEINTPTKPQYPGRLCNIKVKPTPNIAPGNIEVISFDKSAFFSIPQYHIIKKPNQTLSSPSIELINKYSTRKTPTGKSNNIFFAICLYPPDMTIFYTFCIKQLEQYCHLKNNIYFFIFLLYK